MPRLWSAMAFWSSWATARAPGGRLAVGSTPPNKEAAPVGRLVDLSQDIYQGMLVYPGHLKTVVWDHHTHAETEHVFESDFTYASKGLLVSDHGPTHVDALSHLDSRP